MRTDIVRMSNQIARQFDQLSPEVATKAVLDHLIAFWAPEMRAELLRCLDEDPGSLLPPVVAAARTLLSQAR